MTKETLNQARKIKNDEFYTQLEDIEKELKHYEEYFHEKTVYCNCDNPYESNFFKYFVMNFNKLGLKKLISTCYGETPYKAILTEVKDQEFNIEQLLKNKKNMICELESNGDFRSQESIDLLKECDIVVTNPPFSLFREYVAQLIEYDKKFLIIGNINAISYKEIFPLIKENKIWLGQSIHSGDREFRVPDYYQIRTKNCRTDEKGNMYVRVSGIRWFTNMNVPVRNQNITLCKKYNSEEYPKYDNYNAIDISKTADIPYNYEGAMGVPITFMDKYNPKQFEIIGNEQTLGIKGSCFCVNGKFTYARIIIKNKKCEKQTPKVGAFFMPENKVRSEVYV